MNLCFMWLGMIGDLRAALDVSNVLDRSSSMDFPRAPFSCLSGRASRPFIGRVSYPCQHYSAGFIQPTQNPTCFMENAMSWTGRCSHALLAKRHPRVSVTTLLIIRE